MNEGTDYCEGPLSIYIIIMSDINEMTVECFLLLLIVRFRISCCDEHYIYSWLGVYKNRIE